MVLKNKYFVLSCITIFTLGAFSPVPFSFAQDSNEVDEAIAMENELKDVLEESIKELPDGATAPVALPSNGKNHKNGKMNPSVP